MIYLDNAATSFPKPREVIEAQTHCMNETCGNAGRGSHRLALAAAEEIYAAAKETDTVSLCLTDGKLYFHVNGKNLALEGDIAPLAGLFTGKRKIICHDGKHLLHYLKKNGLCPDFIPRDLMLYAYAIDASNGTVTPE